MQKLQAIDCATFAFRVARTGRWLFSFHFQWGCSSTKTVDFDFGVKVLKGIFGSWCLHVAFGLAAITLKREWMDPATWVEVSGLSLSLFPAEWSFFNGLTYRVLKTWYWRQVDIRPAELPNAGV